MTGEVKRRAISTRHDPEKVERVGAKAKSEGRTVNDVAEELWDAYLGSDVEKPVSAEQVEGIAVVVGEVAEGQKALARDVAGLREAQEGFGKQLVQTDAAVRDMREGVEARFAQADARARDDRRELQASIVAAVEAAGSANGPTVTVPQPGIDMDDVERRVSELVEQRVGALLADPHAVDARIRRYTPDGWIRWASWDAYEAGERVEMPDGHRYRLGRSFKAEGLMRYHEYQMRQRARCAQDAIQV